MLTPAVFLATSLGQQVSAQEVADRYLRQLQSSNSVSGVFNLSVSGNAFGQGDVKFALDKDGHFYARSVTSEELFDGKYKYVRNLSRGTYRVYDSRVTGIPLLTSFEPLVNSAQIATRGDLFTGTGNPVLTTFKAQSAVQLAFGNQRRYINPTTALPLAYTDNVNGLQYEAIFKQVNLNPRLVADPFHFRAQAGERQEPVITEGLIAKGASLSNLDAQLGRRFSNSILTVVVFARPSQTASNEAMIGLADLARKSRPKLNVVAVVNETADPAQFFRGRRLPVTTVRDTTDLARAAGVTQYPTMVVVDRDGRVIHAEAAGMEGTVKSVLQSNGFTF